MRRLLIVACAVFILFGGVTSARAQSESDKAIQDYTSVLEMDQSSPEVWWLRGNAYWDKGDYDRALQDYDHSISADPDYALAYLGRGNVYFRKGDYDGAVQQYDHLIDLQPNFIGTYNNRGAAYRENGQRDLALQDFDFAIALNPDFAEAYYNRGLTYRDMGQNEQAERDLKQAVALNPALAKAIAEVSSGAGNKQHHAPALQSPKNAAKMGVKSAKAAVHRVDRKKPNKAIAEPNQARASLLNPIEPQKTASASYLFISICVMIAGVLAAMGFVFLKSRTRA